MQTHIVVARECNHISRQATLSRQAVSNFPASPLLLLLLVSYHQSLDSSVLCTRMYTHAHARIRPSVLMCCPAASYPWF